MTCSEAGVLACQVAEREAIQDNSSTTGFPLLLARIMGNYDVPVYAPRSGSLFRCETLPGPDRRYVMCVGTSMRVPYAISNIFVAPTISL